MRFFSATDLVYEQARATLDAAWGLPNDKGTHTCIEPAASAPHDTDGLVVLAVDDSFCEFSTANDLLPTLIAQGAVKEISRQEYESAAFRQHP